MHIDYSIEKFDTIDSTNDYLQRFLYSNECDINKKYIVISKSQTNGHGSNGRIFISHKDKGIYFSLLLFYDNDRLTENNNNINDFVSRLTPNVCVALKDNFKKSFNKDLDIKWVNDLYYNNKKVIGILCKHFPDKKAIIIGIGVDLYKNDNLPNKLKEKVGYIFDNRINDKDIDILIINIADSIYDNLYISCIKSTYYENNLAINKKVMINNQIGKIISINEKGHLKVEIDGIIKEIDNNNLEILM